ncbi:serine/threonine-protein kinase [Paraliomyxa miuraensis]|uniref:serine/threonine-protein kinase n=1 Tax=Paraliomyxa miuraensis TaxID=376150 RepID=UPI00224F7DB0|nr:serine/threonine-protein kinase [Paraliomyxa miuraensis]MCX4240847.1 serine/threonine-protein kinase [Paraliomyxa miuraensis]
MTEPEDSISVPAPRSQDLPALAMRAQVGAALFGDDAAPLKIGRYEVLETLGMGGMGVVYAAWDESLGRRVALKLLPGKHVGSTRERARLAREAQALAKLSHPNVVHVYEVGEHEHGVFVAMELVEGVSLREWQLRATRTPEELVEVYLQAGRGLAAAHRAGLVHRDFKPANVLVGNDGRVRVVDFGLAQGPGLAAATTSGTGRTLSVPPQSPVTRTGALAGTPAYMAPEQIAGHEADARADQFSFCVALYEALAGCRPFGVGALRLASEPGVPPRPTRGARRIPLLLDRALRRGLAIEPSRRFLDMDALLRAIEARAIWRRRAWSLGGPIALGLFAAWLGSQGASPEPSVTESACETPTHGPAVEWNARKAAVEAAIVGTGKPFAAKAWESVNRRLGAHARQWSDAHVRACREDHEPERARAITQCLDRDAIRFAAVLAELERTDEVTIANVEPVLDSLASVESCLDPMISRGPVLDSETSGAMLERLERARTLATAGRDREADAELVTLLGPSLQTTSGSLRAEIQLLHGRVLTRLERYDAAWEVLTQAQAAASKDEHEVQAILAQVDLADQLERAQSAEDLARQASALIEALDRPPGLLADLLDAQGRLRVYEDPTAAVTLHQRALHERTKISTHDDAREVVDTKLLLANALAVGQQASQARARYQEVLASRERILGKDHPEYAAVLFNLGLLAIDTGELEEARGWLEEALRLERAAFGPDSTRTARSEVMLADTLWKLQDSERALALARHAWDVQRAKLPSRHTDRIAALRALATIELDLGHHAESLARHRLLAEEAGTDGAPDVLHNIGWLQCQVGECAASRPFVDRAQQQLAEILFEAPDDDMVRLELYVLHTSALVAIAEGEVKRGRALLADVIERAAELEGTEELVQEASAELASIRPHR